jgi:demethoxyubiquinone hydroxylase (CLK1/Coq7/Cat5 family)
MPSSEMLRHVDIISSDVSEESIASIIRVTRTGELGTILAVTSIIIRIIRARDSARVSC